MRWLEELVNYVKISHELFLTDALRVDRDLETRIVVRVTVGQM